MIEYIVTITLTPAPGTDVVIIRNEVEWDINEAVSEIQSNLKPTSISYTLVEATQLK